MKIKELISVFLVVCAGYLFMGQLSSGAFKNTYKYLNNLISAPKLATIGTDASVTAITVGNSGTTTDFPGDITAVDVTANRI